MPTLECKPNGPYLVKDLADLRDARGQSLEAKPDMALCRCGGSARKPFCDGSHRRNGFSDARLADDSADRRASYVGRRITLHDNRSLCAHAGHCTDSLASVFKYGSEPWIDADAAEAEAIIAAVRRCPSGALGYTLDGVDGPQEKRPPSVTVTKDGPYAVVGDVQLVGQKWGQGAAKERFTLCRCGASKRKPFCDGSHWAAGFKDPAE